MTTKYYLMHKDFAEPLLAMYPKAARYDNGDLVLTGEFPTGFTGGITDISADGFGEDGLSEQQLTARINVARANNPSGKLIILSGAQGKWLYKNHPSFKPAEIV